MVVSGYQCRAPFFLSIFNKSARPDMGQGQFLEKIFEKSQSDRTLDFKLIVPQNFTWELFPLVDGKYIMVGYKQYNLSTFISFFKC